MILSERPSILLLEDEQAIAETIVYAFETDGFEIRHVMTCMDALNAVLQEVFDFAIFDVGLPDGTGFELCKEIRTFSSIPVIFLTARSDEIDRVVGLEIGGDDYVTKPFSPRELVARVKAVYRRASSVKEALDIAPVNSYADRVYSQVLVLNEESCLFYFKGEVLGLTKAEYSLLQVLYRSPGRVYSRDQLLDQISVDPGAAMDRVIDAHIKSIRSKLSLISKDGKELIETRRGLGYTLRLIT